MPSGAHELQCRYTPRRCPAAISTPTAAAITAAVTTSTMAAAPPCATHRPQHNDPVRMQAAALAMQRRAGRIGAPASVAAVAGAPVAAALAVPRPAEVSSASGTAPTYNQSTSRIAPAAAAYRQLRVEVESAVSVTPQGNPKPRGTAMHSQVGLRIQVPSPAAETPERDAPGLAVVPVDPQQADRVVGRRKKEQGTPRTKSSPLVAPYPESWLGGAGIEAAAQVAAAGIDFPMSSHLANNAHDLYPDSIPKSKSLGTMQATSASVATMAAIRQTLLPNLPLLEIVSKSSVTPEQTPRENMLVDRMWKSRQVGRRLRVALRTRRATISIKTLRVV